MAKVTLAQARDEILSLREMPDGYRVECDNKTDNLMVFGPTLCFCVTRNAIDNGYHKTQFSPAFDGLIEAEAREVGEYKPPLIVH